MRNTFACGLLVIAYAGVVSAMPITLQEVPAYTWYHGCGPTAAASILGYWDLHGYSNMFTAEGWDQVRWTQNVQDQISSPAHNAKYDLNPDDASLPIPPMTSIADWFRTSVDQPYGWSYLGDADDAFVGYANYRGYQFSSWYEGFYAGMTWNDLTAEINAGRPMMFLVDSNGDGETDHFVPVLGYDDRGAGGLWYGCYTTWTETETVAWYQYQVMGQDTAWGVAAGIFVVPQSSPVPLPQASIAALPVFAGVVLLRWRRAARRKGR